MFGSSVPDPLASQITRWRKDAFAHGSYSFVPVGASPSLRRTLGGSDWQGRLWFAGEATSPTHGATAHGALTSGRKAAQALQDTWRRQAEHAASSQDRADALSGKLVS